MVSYAASIISPTKTNAPSITTPSISLCISNSRSPMAISKFESSKTAHPEPNQIWRLGIGESTVLTCALCIRLLTSQVGLTVGCIANCSKSLTLKRARTISAWRTSCSSFSVMSSILFSHRDILLSRSLNKSSFSSSSVLSAASCSRRSAVKDGFQLA